MDVVIRIATNNQRSMFLFDNPFRNGKSDPDPPHGLVVLFVFLVLIFALILPMLS